MRDLPGCASEEALDPFRSARARLMARGRGEAWLAGLALALPSGKAPAGGWGSDGSSLSADPAWAASAAPGDLEWALCHSALHCALGHQGRAGGRDPGAWHAACDEVVDGLLLSLGLARPAALPCSARPDRAGWSAERVYSALGSSEARQRGADEWMEPDSEATAERAVAAALSWAAPPPSLERLLAAPRTPTTGWRELLARLSEPRARDADWTRPSRRGELPGSSRSLPSPPLIMADASESVRPLLGRALALLRAAAPASRVLVWSDGTPALVSPGELAPALSRGGGTDLPGALAWVERRPELAGLPLLVLTDGVLPGGWPRLPPHRAHGWLLWPGAPDPPPGAPAARLSWSDMT